MDIVSPPIRLIAIDIDGTLLNQHKQIAPRTIAAIQAARAQGIVITLATARRYYNTAHLATELGVEIPVILYDGAAIMSHPEGTLLSTFPLSAAIAQQAVDVLAQHGVQPVVHRLRNMVEETWTGPKEFDDAWVAAYFAAVKGPIYRGPYQDCSLDELDPLRVVVFASEEKVQELLPLISPLDCAWNITQRGTYDTAELAIMHRHCSKAYGVQALSRQLGIPITEVMAIGDNYNDREMLQAAGWGVAMGQAPDAVKAVANAVTLSNAEDGVAHAIERYALMRPSTIASNSFNRATWR